MILLHLLFLFVHNRFRFSLESITPNGKALAGFTPNYLYFNNPLGVALDNTGSFLYFHDNTNLIRKYSLFSGMVYSVAGVASWTATYAKSITPQGVNAYTAIVRSRGRHILWYRVD